MIRHLLIFLLLISFNANAIAGSIMLVNMSTMTSATMEKSEMASHAVHSEMHHMSMSDMSMDHKQSQSFADSTCEGDHDCGICMMHFSAALISEITVLDSSPPFSYELNDHSQDALTTHSRLLRPPKLA